MKYVYVILWETEMWGTWKDPRVAARQYLGYRKERDPDLDIESLIQAEVTEILKELEDLSDFPMLIKVPLDTVGEKLWRIDFGGVLDV